MSPLKEEPSPEGFFYFSGLGIISPFIMLFSVIGWAYWREHHRKHH